MTNQNLDYDLAGQVIGCAMEVHRELGHGFNEKVYKNSLAIELCKQGFEVEVEKKIKVYYKGDVVGDFSADIIVKKELILELKAVENLKATNTTDGLIINFGAASLQFKKKFKDYLRTSSLAPKLQSS